LNKITKKLSALALVVAAAVSLSACNDKKEAPKAQATTQAAPAITEQSPFDKKASYAIGASVGAYLQHLQATQEQYIGKLDAELIKLGFADALAEKTALDNKSIESVLRDLDKKVQEAMEQQAKKEAQANLEAGQKFLEENKKKEGVQVTASGLQYKIIKKGEGEAPKPGDTINVTYKGTTIDGKVFDEQKDGVEFPLDNMIPGWVEGLQLMAPGAQFEFYIPSDLAYGEMGAADVIKPNSVLIFDVTLLNVKAAPKAEEAAPAAEAPATTENAPASEASK
jgi:FKBP-type peptidyl-prolyl cis-trans isomerase